MTMQYGTVLRNNQVSQIQTSVGTSGTLIIFAGAQTANCGTADPAGLVLCTITLPAAFLTSSGGVTTLVGTWSATASNGGTAQSFRIKDGSAVCHIQGNVTTDLILNNTIITSGQTVTVTQFSVTAGNP